MARYWIDTDPGLDDALAILLAIREVGQRLVGLSTVQGNVEEPQAARNLSRLLATCDARGLLPPGWSPLLARGSRAPLTGQRLVRATSVHGAGGLGALDWGSSPRWERFSDTFGPRAIVDAARSLADLHLVCIGPLTNLALALHQEPDLPTLLGGLTIMGGSLRAGGNVTLAAEFNFRADAEAAQLVLQAGFPDVRLVPMDGCLAAPIQPADLERLAALATPAARTAAELVAQWGERIQVGGAPLYDPAAWLATTHPEVMAWEPVYVAVDAGHDVARGASLADWRHAAGQPPNVRAALTADRPAVFARFFEALR